MNQTSLISCLCTPKGKLDRNVCLLAIGMLTIWGKYNSYSHAAVFSSTELQETVTY